MTIYGVDTSHHNALGDFRRMKASGLCEFLFAKATEGVGFTDPQYARTRAGAKAAGIIFGAYHFARPGDAPAQADYFLSVARPAAGELTVLDMEDTAIGPATAAWSATWCARVKAATGKPPLIYLNGWFLGAFDWRPVLALDCGLWLAKYDNQPAGGPTGPWPAFVVKQFTDHGTVPGQPGEVDRNASPLTADTLRQFAIGAPTPVPEPDPPPVLEDDDMPQTLQTTDTHRNYVVDGLDMWEETDAEVFGSYVAASGPPRGPNQRQVDVLRTRKTALRAALIADVAKTISGGKVDEQALAASLTPALVTAIVAALPSDSDGPVDVDELAAKVVADLAARIAS